MAVYPNISSESCQLFANDLIRTEKVWKLPVKFLYQEFCLTSYTILYYYTTKAVIKNPLIHN